MIMRHPLRVGLLLAALAIAGCGAKPAVTGPDALLGIWVPDASPRQLLAANGAAPPLTADAADTYATNKRLFEAGDRSFDPTSWCSGPGMPRILTMPNAFEIRRDAARLAFIHDWYRWFRVVDMNGPDPDPPLPVTMGFPVGHWEDDTLVISTVGLTDTTVMDAMGLPHSDELTLVERLRVLPDGRLENRITITDPQTFSEPWETVLTFHRDANARIADDVCIDRIAAGASAENTREAGGAGKPPAATSPGAAATDGAPAPRSLSGIYEPKGFFVMIPDTPLSAAGKEVVDRNAAAMAGGHIMHTAWTSCRPGALSTMTMPREKIVIMESPEEITLLFEMPRMVRRVRMNAAHPEVVTPSYVGDSIGHWEGGTLVIDSIGFNGYAELDARGQPTSPQLHTVERLTPAADGSNIAIQVQITDPGYYTEPFTIERNWGRSEARHPFEYDCMENPRQEDFKNAYYVRDRYFPVCMRVEGEGMAPSRMVCEAPAAKPAF